ncbi:TrlF family AAA-like ATPase [Chloroflexota bacterium]
MPGLKFYKLDLHTHSPASKCYNDKTHTPDQIVQAALEQELDAIAITDHNTAEWIDAMKKASQDTDLVIFPGVEISMNEGFHLVAVFSPNVDQKHVEGFLGAIDIKPDDFGKQESICKKGVYDVFDKIHEREGLAILAHIDKPKGAFFELAKERNGKVRVPQSCSQLFNDPHYDAVECIVGQFPDGFDEAHKFKRFPAFYQASDNPDPEKPTRHSLDGLANMYSWFKMDQVEIEGLRQCFADPEVRIRLMGELEEVSYSKIVSMQVGGAGFLRFQNFQFNEGLNCLIGGKGVGKSVAIELLRYGLEQPSNDTALLSDHLGKLEKRLEADNTIDIIYELSDGTQYKITKKFLGKERVDGGYLPVSETTCTNINSGEEYAGDIASMFPILAYSQTEVIKIAENKDAQLQLIDQLIDARPYIQKIDAISTQLKDNDTQLDKALKAQGRLAECDIETSTLAEQIKQIDNELANPIFENIKQSETKKNALDSSKDFVNGLIDQTQIWKTQAKGMILDDLPEKLKDDEFFANQNKLANQAKVLVTTNLDQLVKDLKELEDKISKDIDEWLPEHEKLAKEYAELLEHIGGDLQAKERKRKRLKKQKNAKDKEASEYRAQIEGLDRIWDVRSELLASMESLYRQNYKTRWAKYQEISRLSDGKLDLLLEHAANHQEFEDKLIDLLKGGQNAPSIRMRRQIAAKIMPRRLVELIIDRNNDELSREAEISETWAGRVIEKLWSSDDFCDVLALQYNCYPGDLPAIHFRKEGGEYGELNELSVGQKCTALLIIALSDGSMPVVIDQPEDALDIVSVWEDVSKKLRRAKTTRQFILTTHNSSVAVASDTDQFIVLRAGANIGRIFESGAIDRPEVQEDVIQHLEGGEEPYNLRMKKYNLG